MLSKNPTIVLVLGFMAGCGAAAIAPLVIPPAHAQVTQRWETLCQHNDATGSRAAGGLMEIGNQAGAQGWEPFSVDGDGQVICFKRPAP